MQRYTILSYNFNGFDTNREPFSVSYCNSTGNYLY